LDSTLRHSTRLTPQRTDCNPNESQSVEPVVVTFSKIFFGSWQKTTDDRERNTQIQSLRKERIMKNQHVRSSLITLVAFLASCCPASSSAKAAPASTNESATCASLADTLVELKKLRLELLGFYVVAKQEKTSELELKVNELRAQRERFDFEERRATQYLAELDAQFASATAEERERIQAEKASRGGPALEALRSRQASLSRKEDDLRSLLASEQQRLAQLKQLITETSASAGR
jgi:hypothetical protein